MMEIGGSVRAVSEEVSRVQDEDISEVMGELGITTEEAGTRLHLILHKSRGSSCIQYDIVDANTLRVYKHRKIYLEFFSGFKSRGD